MPRSSKSLITFGVIISIFAALVAVSMPALTQANGRVINRTTLNAGPYVLSVGNIPDPPQVGALHLTTTVSDAATETFIVNAEVTVTGAGPEGATTEAINAANSPADLTSYDMGTVVDTIGMWTFTFDVSAELGNASAEYAVEVVKPTPLTGIITGVAILVFVVVIGFTIRIFFRDRSRKRQT